MTAEEREMMLAASLTEILDEYMAAGGIDDWRTIDIGDHALTQSTCLLAAIVVLRKLDLQGVRFVR